MKRRLILGLLAALAWGRCAGDDDRVWRDYLAWFRQQSTTPADPVAAYVEHLKRSGMGAAEAGERAKSVARLMRERRDEWQAAFFDKTYTSQTPRFNSRPNALLVETVSQLNRKPGRALDIHMGQGRNAVYLARQGWLVTGFDYSKEGIAAAQGGQGGRRVFDCHCGETRRIRLRQRPVGSDCDELHLGPARSAVDRQDLAGAQTRGIAGLRTPDG